MLTLAMTAGHHEARIDGDTWPLLFVDKQWPSQWGEYISEETKTIEPHHSNGEVFMDPSTGMSHAWFQHNDPVNVGGYQISSIKAQKGKTSLYWLSTSSQERLSTLPSTRGNNIPLLWQERWNHTLQQTQMAAYTSWIVPMVHTWQRMRQPNFRPRSKRESHMTPFARATATPECRSGRRNYWGKQPRPQLPHHLHSQTKASPPNVHERRNVDVTNRSLCYPVCQSIKNYPRARSHRRVQSEILPERTHCLPLWWNRLRNQNAHPHGVS